MIFEICKYSSVIQKLQLLQELNVSTNQLHSLSNSLGNLSKLVMLRAHSNNLSTLPDFHNAKSMRVSWSDVLDVSIYSKDASCIDNEADY